MTLAEILQDAGIQDWGPIAGFALMIFGLLGLLLTAMGGCSKCG